jgi:hydroxymethylpyrimidine pyrophosphatase-like HAD family hydrolase
MYHAKELNAYRSKPTYLEISSKQISKLSALSFLLEQNFPVSLEEVIAFGDNYNDIEMIQGVGLGVAVGNAKEEVKAVANRLTLSNLEDGVAVVLEEVF